MIWSFRSDIEELIRPGGQHLVEAVERVMQWGPPSWLNPDIADRWCAAYLGLVRDALRRIDDLAASMHSDVERSLRCGSAGLACHDWSLRFAKSASGLSKNAAAARHKGFVEPIDLLWSVLALVYGYDAAWRTVVIDAGVDESAFVARWLGDASLMRRAIQVDLPEEPVLPWLDQHDAREPKLDMYEAISWGVRSGCDPRSSTRTVAKQGWDMGAQAATKTIADRVLIIVASVVGSLYPESAGIPISFEGGQAFAEGSAHSMPWAKGTVCDGSPSDPAMKVSLPVIQIPHQAATGDLDLAVGAAAVNALAIGVSVAGKPVSDMALVGSIHQYGSAWKRHAVHIDGSWRWRSRIGALRSGGSVASHESTVHELDCAMVAWARNIGIARQRVSRDYPGLRPTLRIALPPRTQNPNYDEAWAVAALAIQQGRAGAEVQPQPEIDEILIASGYDDPEFVSVLHAACARGTGRDHARAIDEVIRRKWPKVGSPEAQQGASADAGAADPGADPGESAPKATGLLPGQPASWSEWTGFRRGAVDTLGFKAQWLHSSAGRAIPRRGGTFVRLAKVVEAGPYTASPPPPRSVQVGSIAAQRLVLPFDDAVAVDRHRSAGRLGQNLARAAFCPNVFEREAEERRPALRVHLIVDASGSMSTAWPHVVTAAAGVACAAEQVEGFDLHVGWFSGAMRLDAMGDPKVFHRLVWRNGPSGGEVWAGLGRVKPEGGTAIASSLRAAREFDESLSPATTLYVVLTDGEDGEMVPDPSLGGEVSSTYPTRYECEKIRSGGADVMGIFIMHESFGLVDDHEYRTRMSEMFGPHRSMVCGPDDDWPARVVGLLQEAVRR